jgi:hyperosmotically inducible protein
MKTLSKVAGALLVSVLVLGAAGCAQDSNRRGVDQTGEVVSDSWITTKVKTDILADKQVSATHIHVKTVDGVVTLSGTTDSQADIDRAIQDANSVKGVKSVVNNIEIKS